MNPQIEILLTAVFMSAACALPGSFLVVRNMSMTSDAITHTVLLGIVLGFLLTGDLNSPILIIGAGIVGVLTVWFTETLDNTGLVDSDASNGLVFPLLFSVGVILITLCADSVHLDTDSVLLGELAFAPFDRLTIFGKDIGAKSVYFSMLLFVLNLLFVLVFYKELKFASFDETAAKTGGFHPEILHYALMTCASITAVVAFQWVGSVLVVAFMIAPPAAALLLTKRLSVVLALSCALGGTAAAWGYKLASALDVSISGTMAVMTGVIFIIILIITNLKITINKKTARF